jgi:hypothetical protein
MHVPEPATPLTPNKIDPIVVDDSTRHMRRFRWVEVNLPDLVDDLVGEALENSTYGYTRQQAEAAIHEWFDAHQVPHEGLVPDLEALCIESLHTELSIRKRYTDAASPPETSETLMADKDKAKVVELKSREFIEKHSLAEKVLLADNNIVTLPEDYRAAILASEQGITVEEVKKQQKIEQRVDQSLLAATTLLSGELAKSKFVADPEAREVAFSYEVGPHAKASGVFTRNDDGTVAIVNAVEHRFQTAEMNRVYGHLNDLFANVNS